MAKPVVLAAWEPEDPEEALAVERVLGRRAEVHWGHELGPELRRDLLPRVDVVLLFYWPAWLTEHLPRMRRLRFVQRLYAGVETLPLAQLRTRQPPILVAGASGSNAAPVAEHAWALLFACAKRVARRDAEIRLGAWRQWEQPSRDLELATLGILGYGAVGQRVARLGRALGMNVLALKRSPPFRPPVIGDLRRLQRVLRESDAVVVALPHTRATDGLLDAKRLAWMKRDAILVNVARGPIVDEDALFERLRQFPDFWAGLDVYWTPPGAPNPARQRRPFQELKNVVLTPHVASLTPGWRLRAIDFAANNVARYVAGREPKNVANLRDYA